MNGALTDFLARLAAHGREPLLAKTSGRVCFESFDDDGTERQLVCIDNGEIEVVPGDVGADATLRGPREVLDRVAAGEVNAMAAVLRGEITIDGNWELLVRFQRLFPLAHERTQATVA